MEELGGFLELELCRGHEFHPGAIRLNSGRNAFAYIMKAKKYRKVYFPTYICDSLIAEADKMRAAVRFYRITGDFEPVIDKDPKPGEVLLYVNYFGIKGDTAARLSKAYGNLIVDNAQAFFSPRIDGRDTFYSPRKFFGVPDGGYLYTDTFLRKKPSQDKSYARFAHLLQRIDRGGNASYSLYARNEQMIGSLPLKSMSALTGKLLQSVDYQSVRLKRERNFLYVHSRLNGLNELAIPVHSLNAPMVYPFLFPRERLREYLLKQNIYVATYWKELLERCAEDSVEYRLAKYLIPLPIDQRYELTTLDTVCSHIIAWSRGK